MRLLIRKILAPILNDANKKKLKKWEFKTRKGLIKKLPKLNEKEFKKILINSFNLEKGDHLFVHASLSLINTDLTSEDVFEILQDIVGINGSITVPCFPGMSSKKFMKSRRKFDVNTSMSGMGEFSEYVRKHRRSFRSLHPTKSIASIGLPKEILEGHEHAEYPFGVGSPYQKLLEYNPKIVGIGVPMSYLSFVHIAEDINAQKYPLQVNETEKLSKICIDSEGIEHVVNTYVHDMDVVVKANPEKYVTNNMNNQYWKIKKWYMTPFFVVDGKQLTESITRDFDNNITVYN